VSASTIASGRFLLDTNIVIGMLDGDAGILTGFQQAEMVFISTVVLGELYYGAAKSGRPAENVARIDRVIGQASVIPVSVDVAKEYGVVKQELRQKGRPIPENDIWIAATARKLNLVLVTRDRHFDEVDGLTKVDWTNATPVAG
jgi:tRNA(fMet)-specific endonuclease VapC